MPCSTQPGGRFIAPAAPRFAGRVWELVGQPTGGNQRGITGGAFFFLRLPSTGIELDVPLIGQFPLTTTLPPDAGLARIGAAAG